MTKDNIEGDGHLSPTGYEYSWGAWGNYLSYGFNYNYLSQNVSSVNPQEKMVKAMAVEKPSQTVWMADTAGDSGGGLGRGLLNFKIFEPSWRHEGNSNCLQVDGHIDKLSYAELTASAYWLLLNK